MARSALCSGQTGRPAGRQCVVHKQAGRHAGMLAGRQCVMFRQAMGRLRRQTGHDLGAAGEGQVGKAGEGVQHSHALVSHPGAAQQSQVVQAHQPTQLFQAPCCHCAAVCQHQLPQAPELCNALQRLQATEKHST